MDEFLSEADCAPNMNTVIVAGKVIRAEKLTGKTVGISFVVGYQKHWRGGDVQEIPIRCYLTGAERTEKTSWLRPGEVVLVRGEVTDKGAVFAHQLEQLSKPARDPSEADAYLRGMSRTSQR